MSRRAREGRLPTFLLIGAQKSATTSLIHALGLHPDIFTLRNEVHFFTQRYQRGIDWYRQQFTGSKDQQAVGESSPNYMYLEEGPARIARHLPGVKLIAILRDPVDRAYSHYWHNRTRGHERLSFSEAIAVEAERLSKGDQAARARFSYLDRGRYLPQLLRVADRFPRDALRVVLFEDFRDDRLGTVRSLSRFLDVDDRLVLPKNRGPRNRYVTFRAPGLRRPIRRLPGPLRKVAVRLNARHTTYPLMPPEQRRDLLARFEEHNAALADWLGRDLSGWCRIADASIRSETPPNAP